MDDFEQYLDNIRNEHPRISRPITRNSIHRDNLAHEVNEVRKNRPWLKFVFLVGFTGVMLKGYDMFFSSRDEFKMLREDMKTCYISIDHLTESLDAVRGYDNETAEVKKLRAYINKRINELSGQIKNNSSRLNSVHATTDQLSAKVKKLSAGLPDIVKKSFTQFSFANYLLFLNNTSRLYDKNSLITEGNYKSRLPNGIYIIQDNALFDPVFNKKFPIVNYLSLDGGMKEALKRKHPLLLIGVDERLLKKYERKVSVKFHVNHKPATLGEVMSYYFFK